MNKARVFIPVIALCFAAATWASPVLLGANVLVRDATGLILLTAGK